MISSLVEHGLSHKDGDDRGTGAPTRPAGEIADHALADFKRMRTRSANNLEERCNKCTGNHECKKPQMCRYMSQGAETYARRKNIVKGRGRSGALRTINSAWQLSIITDPVIWKGWRSADPPAKRKPLTGLPFFSLPKLLFDVMPVFPPHGIVYP